MTPGFWVLPTLRRPQNVARLINSYRDVGEHAPVVVFLWKDDPSWNEYINLPWPSEWDRIVVDEEFTAAKAMRMALEWAPDAEFYGFLGDDILFRTKWSEQLREASLPHFVAWPDDGYQGANLPTHFVCGGNLVRKIGWWAVPGMEHYGLDVAWKVLDRKCPGLLRYCPEVRWEHRHWFKDRRLMDDVYRKAQRLHDADSKEWRNGAVGDILEKAGNAARELVWS